MFSLVYKYYLLLIVKNWDIYNFFWKENKFRFDGNNFL